VLHTPTNTPYALKCMRKGQIVALKQVRARMGVRVGVRARARARARVGVRVWVRVRVGVRARVRAGVRVRVRSSRSSRWSTWLNEEHVLLLVTTYELPTNYH
jgi:hypothetical protein